QSPFHGRTLRRVLRSNGAAVPGRPGQRPVRGARAEADSGGDDRQGALSVGALLDWFETAGFHLSQTLQGQLHVRSLASIFVVFAGGVLTSFTPCVYPMIPVTVSYIGGAAGGSRRRAVGLSLVYVSGLAIV